jgi:hypothetical protein
MNDDCQSGGPASSDGKRQSLVEQLEAVIPLASAVDATVEFFIRLAIKRLTERQEEPSRKNPDDRN